MTLHEFAPRRIAALLCALALTMSLIPGAAFAEAAELLPSADGGLAGAATNESAATDESAAAAEGPLPVAAAYAASRMSAAALPLANGPSFSDYTVKDAVTPEGTTIDLFNYDKEQINNSSHVLQFEAGLTAPPESPLNETTVNAWTGEEKPPRTGIVANTLTNGYPTLSGGANGTSFAKESLAYLFDRNPAAGKTVYSDVRGLLQVDNDGYFYYDCTQNFASFDQDSNSFTLYKEGAVNPGGSSIGWQFFPWPWAVPESTVNTQQEVFNLMI